MLVRRELDVMHRAGATAKEVVLLGSIALAAGCFGTPRVEDAHAPRAYWEEVVGSRESKCDRPIDVVPAHAMLGRARREVANITVSCYPGVPWVCERLLKERACELGADAVLLSDAEPGPNPAGGSRQSMVSKSGRAVRWEE